MNLRVDRRDAAGAAGYGRSDELPAEAQQAAGHLVDVQGRRFGARAGRRRYIITNKFK